MTLLTPKTFDLLASTAPDTEYPEWMSWETYAVDEHVIYSRYIYKCLTATPSSSTWNDHIQYAKGDRADYSALTYVMISDYIHLPSPDSDARYDQQTYTVWNDTTAYIVGDVVMKDSWYPMLRSMYRCIQANTGQSLYDSAYWEPATTWSDAVFYAANAFVTLGVGPGVPYVVNTAITADTPDIDTDHWAVPTPAYDTESWLKVGPANSLRMFDSQNTTKTYGDGSLQVALQGYEVDGLFFAGVEADSITVHVYDATTETLIEETTFDMTYEPEDWLEYFTGVWMERSRTSYTYWRTTLTRDVIFVVTFDNGAENASCGAMIVGSAKQLGASIWDVRLGGADYTVVAQNSDGSSTASEGTYLPLIDIDAVCDTDATARIKDDLHSVKGKPIAIIGDETDTYEAVNIFGVISSFYVSMKGPSKSTISLEVTGLF